MTVVNCCAKEPKDAVSTAHVALQRRPLRQCTTTPAASCQAFCGIAGASASRSRLHQQSMPPAYAPPLLRSAPHCHSQTTIGCSQQSFPSRSSPVTAEELGRRAALHPQPDVLRGTLHRLERPQVGSMSSMTWPVGVAGVLPFRTA